MNFTVVTTERAAREIEAAASWWARLGASSGLPNFFYELTLLGCLTLGVRRSYNRGLERGRISQEKWPRFPSLLAGTAHENTRISG